MRANARPCSRQVKSVVGPSLPNAVFRAYYTEINARQQLAAIREDEEFQRNLIDASLIVDGLRQIEGVTNNEIARQMGLYQESIARVPQTA